MKISLSDIGKRFNREWIFRHVSFTFETGNPAVITGSNGSGKSTLLQLIAGAITHNEGSIRFEDKGKEIPAEQHYQRVSIAAPYLALPDEMTLTEFLHFHTKFKPLIHELSVADVIEIMGLEKAADKQIRYFSSGMLQRVKLAQAVFSDTPAILLDEPGTNLDEQGIALYLSLVHNYCQNRLVIISSNDPKEYPFCTVHLPITRYKS
jgi:ABC-type multidrug transport system ATPase subunit